MEDYNNTDVNINNPFYLGFMFALGVFVFSILASVVMGLIYLVIANLIMMR
jgi:hypothetical protein